MVLRLLTWLDSISCEQAMLHLHGTELLINVNDRSPAVVREGYMLQQKAAAQRQTTTNHHDASSSGSAVAGKYAAKDSEIDHRIEPSATTSAVTDRQVRSHCAIRQRYSCRVSRKQSSTVYCLVCVQHDRIQLKRIQIKDIYAAAFPRCIF